MLSLSASALALPALLGSSGGALAQADHPKLRVSSYRLDRTAALFSGQVTIEGVDATFIEDAIGDMNTRAFTRSGANEITELGLHPFMLAHANEGFRDYALLPVFLLRQFRHKSVFVRTGAGINKPEGTGLGLAICKAIIEAHDGKIWAESVKGESSTFYFSLLKKRPQPPEPDSPINLD